MTEIQEVVQAIYEKHKALWPLTGDGSVHLARMQIGDESTTIITHVSHALFQFNKLHPTVEGTCVDPEPPLDILERIARAHQSLSSLDSGGLDLRVDIQTLRDASALIGRIQQCLDGKEWDSDTTDAITHLLRNEGLEIREPRDDTELTAAELQERYAEDDGGWGEHPRHARSVWKGYVSCNDTQRGYWDWVVAMLEQEND